MSSSSGFRGFKPLRTLCSLRLKTLRLPTSDFQPSTNFRVFRVFAAAGAPLRGCGLPALATSALPRLVVKLTHFYTFYTIYTVKLPNSKQLKTNLQADGRFSASLHPPLSKIIHRSSRYSRLPLPSIGLNSMHHIIRFPLQYGKFTSILR